jgi:hypothetical protein
MISALLSAVWRVYLYDKGGNELDKDWYGLVKYLLEHGADPNVNIYATGDTPLRIAERARSKRSSGSWNSIMPGSKEMK